MWEILDTERSERVSDRKSNNNNKNLWINDKLFSPKALFQQIWYR